MSDDYSRGFRDGYRQGKEVGLSESERGGEVASLREQLQNERNQSGTAEQCRGECGSAFCSYLLSKPADGGF